jgi:hypothetical protein
MLTEIAQLAETAALRVQESISTDYLQHLEAVDIHCWDAPDDKFWCLTWRATWKDKDVSQFQIVYPAKYIHKEGMQYILGRTVNRLLREVFELQQEEIDQEPYPWQIAPK